MIKENNVTTKKYIIVTLITSLWVHISETFRYLVYIRPELIDKFGEGVAIFDLKRFVIWGFWDTLLTGLIVFSLIIFMKAFGGKNRIWYPILFSWLFFFGLFWVGMYNMQLATIELTIICMVLSFIEVTIATLIAKKLLG